MLFHDRVDVWTATLDIDEMGNDVLVWSETQNVPAQVVPLGTEQTIDDSRDSVTTRYRVVLSKTVTIPHPTPPNGVRITWGPYVASDQSNHAGLTLDGAVERHMLRGHLHHYEMTTRAVVG